MKTIDTPPSHPERWPWIQYPEIPGMWVRIPTPGQARRAMLSHSEESDPVVRGEAICGSLIAIAWCSHTHALEEGGGPAVFDELHSAGWSAEKITALANFIMGGAEQASTTEEDVKAAEDFTETTPPT